jgi:hypothetical protein
LQVFTDTDEYVDYVLRHLKENKDWYLGDEDLMDKIKWVESSPKNFLEPSDGK